MQDRLAEALADKGMTPAALIKQVGVSKATVYWILDGKTKAETVRADTAFRIADALGVQARWLVTGRGPKIAGESQSAGLPVENIAAAMKSLRDYLESTGKPSIRLFDPDYLAPALKLHARSLHPGHLEGMEFAREIQQVESGHDRGREAEDSRVDDTKHPGARKGHKPRVAPGGR